MSASCACCMWSLGRAGSGSAARSSASACASRARRAMTVSASGPTPCSERLARLGGLHDFMGWERPILTDSGGYQVMSLSELTKVSEEGVAFASHLDGSRHMLSPERSMEIQTLLGSDIVMAFDQLVKTTESREAQVSAMERSMRWARRSRDAFDVLGNQGALFGIQQGGL